MGSGELPTRASKAAGLRRLNGKGRKGRTEKVCSCRAYGAELWRSEGSGDKEKKINEGKGDSCLKGKEVRDEGT